MAITIMIVDDSKLARIVARRHITALQPDWEQIEAANADEAMGLMAQKHVDVALVDYNMPGKNGLELAKEMQAQQPGMPLALITANLQEQVIAGARDAGATYVSKPLTETALRQFITKAAAQIQPKI